MISILDTETKTRRLYLFHFSQEIAATKGDIVYIRIPSASSPEHLAPKLLSELSALDAHGTRVWETPPTLPLSTPSSSPLHPKTKLTRRSRAR